MNYPVMYKYPIEDEMVIHSLGGKLANAKILGELGDNDYLAEYNGVRCHAIFNPFVGRYYVDDKYRVIQGKATGAHHDMAR